ncbi:MAG TPA: CheR family methyltransferase [Pyrinomonadaceae bacterium]|nr:CheR family methyltransferase [Pyrinomonadaceae bacterium]
MGVQNHKSNHEPAETQSRNSERDFLVVGVGASAGGIQALKSFFSRVPKDSGMAYVVILHMSPQHESKLAEILQTASEIPVRQVTERIKIEPDHVYVIPPNRTLGMTDGHLALFEIKGPESRRSPIDIFFTTLAENNEERGVSVVLSGSGADGSLGVKRVKEYGGVAFTQNPEEAEYGDMPRNAMATGLVDYVLPVAQIPAKIISYKEHFGIVHLPLDEVPKDKEHALLEIFTQLRIRTGHDFSNYKRGTISRRIERRLGLREIKSLDEYARILRTDPQEAHLLMKDLLISVTSFFRDQQSMEKLAKIFLPRIVASVESDRPVRIWVAGCATGEEAYSLAMLLFEMTDHEQFPNFQIFATDLDQSAIDVAREGFYKEADVVEISPERLRRFFERQPGGYRIRREVREAILFAAHNVIKDPPFSHLDLVSCRNLLIYLNRKIQTRLLEIFHFALNASGTLFLGGAESIDGAGDLFTPIDKEHLIFASRPVPPRTLPVPEVSLRPHRAATFEKEKTPEESRAIERLQYVDLHERLLEQYGPPSVLVNAEHEIVHLSENAGRYLQIVGGNPSYNLLRIVHPELRLQLRTALYQAVQDRVNVEVRGLHLDLKEGPEVINLLVKPVMREQDPSRGFILVVFEEVSTKGKKNKAPASKPAARGVGVLEEQLVTLKSQLRATVEQYEVQQEELRASNEELQAMNEELRSSAEELETSKEELQSVNEELSTVNQELKIKIDELSEAVNNFTNLMNATNIGTIFVDRQLIVRQFTPSALETFNLIPTDIGRALTDITNKLKDVDLLGDMNSVLERLQTVEREVKSVEDRSYMLRMSPYRTSDDRIAGVVITLVDVSDLTRAREDLKRAGERLETGVAERTRELADANEALRAEMNEREQVEEARRELLGQLVSAQEDERRRFALDLHDQLGQGLTALRLKLDSMSKQVDTPLQLRSGLGDLETIARQLDSDVDFLAWQMRPVTLDDLGLAAALSNYVKEWSQHYRIAAQFRAGASLNERFDPHIENNLYRIAQEALNNCAKHAKCTRATVLLERREDEVVLIVEDDGFGFDQEIVQEGQWGLIGMRERAALMNGSLEIESDEGAGTTIFARVKAKVSGDA